MSGRSSEAGPSGPPAVGSAVLVAALLVIVLATWAAAIGPDRVFESDANPPDTAGVSSDDERPAVEPEGGRDDDEDEERGWGGTAVLGIQLALLLTGLYLLVLLVRWARSEATAEHFRRRRRTAEFEVLPAAPGLAAEEIVRDADEQTALLLRGTPRNGIVACWHRFEVQAGAAGIGRQPWETSAEFTLRVLDLVSADERAVAELAVLYREARFSDHDLDESVRAAAVDALARIHRGLGARFAGGAHP